MCRQIGFHLICKTWFFSVLMIPYVKWANNIFSSSYYNQVIIIPIITLVSGLYKLSHPTVPHEITDMRVRIFSSHFHTVLPSVLGNLVCHSPSWVFSYLLCKFWMLYYMIATVFSHSNIVWFWILQNSNKGIFIYVNCTYTENCISHPPVHLFSSNNFFLILGSSVKM